MSRRAIKVPAVSVAALVVGSVFGLSVAQATRTVRIASHISIRGKGLTFRGRVTSPKAACERARRVTLHRTNGNVLGSTTTTSTGHWTITASGSAGISLGHFFATVKRRAEGTAGTIFVCKAARSMTIPFHQ
jgi:hypothetical protein